MKFRFTISRPATTITSIPTWEDLGNGAAAWVADFTDQTVTLGAFQTSNWLADYIVNPYNGTYNFTFTASGTVSGGAGNTGQITFHFLDADQNIIESGDAINIPNAGLTDYAVSLEGGMPAYVMLQVNNLTGSSNDITVAVTFDAPASSQEIAEPGGWNGCTMKLERHPEFYSLIESVESPSRLVFIGDDNEDGEGGAEFIRETERFFGVDAGLSLLVEIAPDNLTYEHLFSGLLQLEGLLELPENEIEVPLIREDKWTTFINRIDTPVDLTSNTSLNGTEVDPVEPVTLNLTSQIIEVKYHAYTDDAGVSYPEFINGEWFQVDFNDVVILDEIKERFTIPRFNNPELPAGNFSTEYGGDYIFDIRIIASTFTTFDAESVKDPTDMLDVFIQFNNQAPIAFSWADETVGSGTHTVFTYSATHELLPNTTIRIYGRANTTSAKDLVFLGGSSVGFSGSSEYATYCKITANTIFRETQVQGYWLHDVFKGVIDRITQ